MIILDDLRVEMTGYRKEMTELADVLDIKAAKARIEQLGEETGQSRVSGTILKIHRLFSRNRRHLKERSKSTTS